MNIVSAASVIACIGLSVAPSSALAQRDETPDRPVFYRELDDEPSQTFAAWHPPMTGPDLASQGNTGQDAQDPAVENDLHAASRFVEQGLDQVESPFTRSTVLTLNGIVDRSLTAIREFDAIRQHRTPTDNASVAEILGVYRTLSDQATLARTDLNEARDRLRDSGERYNKEILSAMVHFVENVDEEIREETDRLRAIQQSSTD